MKITRCTLSQEHWYCCTRKPTICPYCGEKAVRKSIFGYPSPELFYSKKYHLQGCMPDFPRPRDWGCVSCDAAFFKESEAVVDYMAQTYKETDDQVDDWFEVAREKVSNYRANERFTDINVPYKEPDPDDMRSDEEVLRDMEKNLGVKVIRASEKPPEAF